MKRTKTPTFLLELPLAVHAGQAKHLGAHFEAARCLYNTLLGEALKRLNQMRADPAWQAARALPKTQKQEREAAFSHLRPMYGFSAMGERRHPFLLLPPWNGPVRLPSTSEESHA